MFRAIVIGVLLISVPAAVIALFIGVRWTVTEPATSPYWGGYEAGQSLRLNFSVFIIDASIFGFSPNWALVPAATVSVPYGRLYMAPSTIAAYERHGTFPPDELDVYEGLPFSPPEILGVAQTGVMIEVTRLARTVGWSAWAGGAYTTFTVYGTIRSGEFAGVTVDMSDMSTSEQFADSGPFVHSPFDVAFDPSFFPKDSLTLDPCADDRQRETLFAECD